MASFREGPRGLEAAVLLEDGTFESRLVVIPIAPVAEAPAGFALLQKGSQQTSPDAAVENVDSRTLQNLVAESTQLIVLELGAKWCGPCRALRPVLETLAREFSGQIRVVTLDADLEPDLVSSFGPMGFPTVLFIQGGREVADRVEGYGRGVGTVIRSRIEAALELNNTPEPTVSL